VNAGAQETLIRLTNVSLALGGTPILDGVSLDVHAGEILTLIGPNGSGKTSLIRVLLGLVPPDEGEVDRGQNLRVGYVPQKLQVAPSFPMTVQRFVSLSGERDPKLIALALEKVGADHLVQSQMHGLSGGEMQRVAMARAIVRRPNLLVLDEPAQGVDISGQLDLYNILGQLCEETGCSVLLVSHDLHFVMAATDQVICLNKHVCCAGKPEAVRRDPEFSRLFGPRAARELAIYTHEHDHDHGLGGEVTSEGAHHD
jgi:zinc transport system ATP-binding protein